MQHTLLFDAGPEGEIWEKNANRLKLVEEIGKIELIHLSHWHRDHSGTIYSLGNKLKTNLFVRWAREGH